MEHFSRLLQVQLVSSDRLHDHPITGLQSADVIVKIHWTKVKIHWKISKIRFLKNTKRQYLVTTSGKFHPQKNAICLLTYFTDTLKKNKNIFLPTCRVSLASTIKTSDSGSKYSKLTHFLKIIYCSLCTRRK